LAPLTSLSLVGQEHGRTIPLADIDLQKDNIAVTPNFAFSEHLSGNV
jgi:hypothetical protein